MLNEPALLLPLRFVNTSDINDSFDGNFANRQAEEWQMGNKCYQQKFQRSDTLALQWISDTPLSDLLILNESGQIVSTVEWTASELTLVGYPDFTIYEIEFQLNSLQEGIYIIQQDEWEAEAIDLRDEHPNTLLARYKNSENDNDVVFDTGIEFQFRFEGGIGNYIPKNQRDVYVNQIYNPSQLKSVAHRQFTLYVGFQTGVPEWVLDKANIITQCDEVFYDNVQYQPINEAEFEVIRADDITIPVGGTIDVEPTNNFIKFVTGENPQQQTVRIVRRTHQLLSISGNQAVAGLFKQASKLQEVVVYKSGADFTLRIGVTPNGNEIGEFLINNNTGVTELVNWAFNADTTIYLSGSGLNADSLYLVYDQMDAPEIPLNSSAADELGKGATTLWTGTIPELNAAFDTTTGLGQSNTKWIKWCIAGTNGTTDYNNAYPVGIDVDEIGQDYSTLGNKIGANNKQITRSVLPAEGLKSGSEALRNGFGGGISAGTRTLPAGSIPNFIEALTEKMGDGNDFNVQPLSVISLYIVKIID